jgi:hypothetical protein
MLLAHASQDDIQAVEHPHSQVIAHIVSIQTLTSAVFDHEPLTGLRCTPLLFDFSFATDYYKHTV